MYEFFLSYARDNYNPLLQKFYEDLSQSVRNLLGVPNSQPVSFLDQEGIRLGQPWDPALVDALQRSKVMVAIGSPLYFKQEYCGKEWAFFSRRLAAHTAQGGAQAPLLKPVMWLHYAFDQLPGHVAALHQTLGESKGLVNEKGLSFVLNKYGRRGTAYVDYVDALARDIVEAGKKPVAPPLAAAPTLADIASAWVLSPPAAPPPPDESEPSVLGPKPPPPRPPAPAAGGRKRVRFIYVAAHPSNFGTLRNADSYLENGAGDWRPFFPADARPIDPLLAQVATRDDLLFSYEERAFDANLLQEINDALDRRQIVVIVVDPWTLYWDSLQPVPTYNRILRELDQRIGYHWSVLVPDTDGECTPRREDIYAVVRSTFDLHANVLKNPTFYRDGITSATELQAVVAELLTRLKEEINKRAEVVRPVAAMVPRQTISGPSAAQP